VEFFHSWTTENFNINKLIQTGMMITPMRVFVLLFNARTENEGIHTIREGDRNKVLMFESQDDAERFDWEIVPVDGALIIPPEINVEETDWQVDAEENNPSDQTSQPDDSQFSESELDRLRRKLEGLL
jgi:hypothetical protein